MTGPRVRQVRIILWSFVVLVGIGATALFLLAPPSNPVNGGIGGGTYSLVDQRGAPVDQTMLVGQPSMLFFGYTHCPDVCPTTMAEMSAWFATLGDDARDLRAFFITVDPSRDTPAILDGYVSWVSDRITGVTGPQAEIDKAVRAWGVTAEKVPGEGADYTMNHTASVFLINAKGEFEGTIAYGEDMDTAVAKIRKLIAS